MSCCFQPYSVVLRAPIVDKLRSLGVYRAFYFHPLFLLMSNLTARLSVHVSFHIQLSFVQTWNKLI